MAVFDGDASSTDALKVFEHAPGCRVCHGHFKHYTLPDGRVIHMFKAPRTIIDQVQVSPRPLTTLSSATVYVVQLGVNKASCVHTPLKGYPNPNPLPRCINPRERHDTFFHHCLRPPLCVTHC